MHPHLRLAQKQMFTCDRILFDKDAYQKLIDWHKEEGFEKESLDIPFEEGVIIIPIFPEENTQPLSSDTKKDALWIFFTFNADTDFMSVTVFTRRLEKFNPVLTCDFNMRNYPDEASIKATSLTPSGSVTEEDVEENAKMFLSLVPRALNFITHYKGEIKQTQHRVNKTKKGKVKNGKPSKNRIVKIGITTYSFPASDSALHRSYERHIGSWKVRGHWRYYKKTGKRVWISPHKKGVGETAAKEYCFVKESG